MIPRIARIVARRPVAVLLACAAGFVALAAGLRNFEIDRSIDAIIMPDDPDKPFLDRMKALFGSDEIVVLAVVAPEGSDVFAPGTLARLQELTAALERIPGVAEVKSLANANHIEAAPDGVRTEPLFYKVPEDPAALAEIRRKALSDPLFLGNLVSRDGRAAALVCTFSPECDADPKKQFPAALAIRAVAREADAAGPERVYASGVPLNKVANSEMARRDLRTIGPVLLLANAIMVLLLYRTLRGLVLPVLAIVLTVVATLGIMGHAGIPINTFTNYVPLFLIMLGACYGVHTMTHYYFEVGREGLRPPASAEARAAVIENFLRDFLYPFALIVLTTFVGFASLASNSIPGVWQLGLFTAVGCLVLFPLCGFGIGAALRLLDAPRRLPPKPREAWGQPVWIALARLGTRRRWLMVGIWAGLVGASLLFAARIEQSTNTLEWLPEQHELRRAEEAIREQLGATAVLNLFIDTGRPDGAIEP